MSPLYLFNNKLLIKNNKLANNSDCCCFVCKITRCGCDEYQYIATYSQLWIDIQNWITSENYTCNGDPVNCGAWEPKLINGVPQRDCCSQACYDIWEHILSHVGYDQETIDSKSPAELDVLCSSITVQPTFFPTDKNNPNTDLFDSISYNDRYHVTILDTKHKAGELGSPCLPDLTEILCDDPSLQPVTFAILTGDGTLTANIDSNALDLLKTGTCLPHEKTTNYTNAENCRNCYGALFKLGTYDTFGRIDANPDFMTGVLINANSGDLKSTTDFSFSTSSKLTPTDCITKKFPGTDPINPYGILTSQLASSPTVVNASSETPNYFEFDLRYKYEISWDNTNWYAATNKWTVKYGPQPSNNPSFSFESDVNNYYQNNIPQPISASISSLDFDPVTISTKISVNWGGNGILIGNSSCSFSDSKLSKIGDTRLEPTLTISSTGNGTGCSFTPILQQLTETNGQPYWIISEVTINGSGSGYSNNEILSISTNPGDIAEVNAVLKLQTTMNQIEAPEISGNITASSTSPAILSISTEKYQNNPDRWRVNDITIVNSGSGYDDGVYDINFEVYNNSIEEISATGVAVTERVAPNFSYSLVSVSGQGGSINNVSLNLVRNSNGQKAWNFDYFICNEDFDAFSVGAGGSGYLSTDYLELALTEPYIIDTNYTPSEYAITQHSPGVWRLPLDVDGGAIVGINGGNIFNTEAFYNPTGKIETVIIIDNLYTQSCGHTYPSDNPSVFGGSYYKEISGGIPTGILIENSGKYYHPNPGTVRPVAGPCISGIQMDIWHPGPCGISEVLKSQTSSGTSWNGYYYGDLIQNVYRKFWRWNNNGGSLLSGNCPCCKPVDLILGVVKQEGCENFTIPNNYDIPLEQWEIDFNFCDILTADPNVYKRYCFSDNYRYNCCSAFDYGCGGNPTDYRDDGYPCVPGSTDPPSEQCPSRSPGIPFQNGGFALVSGVFTCQDMTPGQSPNFYPDYWQNCPVITKENAPWKKTDINCP